MEDPHILWATGVVGDRPPTAKDARGYMGTVLSYGVYGTDREEWIQSLDGPIDE